jgi:hypothetical protein
MTAFQSSSPYLRLARTRRTPPRGLTLAGSAAGLLGDTRPIDNVEFIDSHLTIRIVFCVVLDCLIASKSRMLPQHLVSESHHLEVSTSAIAHHTAKGKSRKRIESEHRPRREKRTKCIDIYQVAYTETGQSRVEET